MALRTRRPRLFQQLLRISILTVLCGVAIDASVSQVPPFTPADERLSAYIQLSDTFAASLFDRVEFRRAGPTIMSGRIVDVDVSPQDPTHFYVAYASGGLWRSTSNGTRFEPVFDGQPVITIGDIAVAWSDPEIIYVGTGENNSSRSSYAGTGLYRSDDRGETWTHLGLAETHHIGRIVLDPDDAETILVAAIGHLYSKNSERGVFKSTDGGSTWRQTLSIDDSTGVIDLLMQPNHDGVLYAASWHRQRMAWDFVEAGETSGIYRSDDLGETWELVTTTDSGFPVGSAVGRIGLAATPADPNLLFAVVDNQGVSDEPDEDRPALTFEMLDAMDAAGFARDVSMRDLKAYLEYHGFPDAYDADSVSALIESGDVEPSDLVRYVGDANRALFDSPVIGCEVYRSADQGQTWTRTHEEALDDTCHTYGYYFGQIWVSPHDVDEVYVAGVPLLKSIDGGQTWSDVGRENVHVDHHALWINPDRHDHLINGNDGGLNMSYDGGESWLKLNSPTVGQFYTVAFDNEDPYNVYGGLQDNGVWVGPSDYEAGPGWQAEGFYPYQRLLGGDGMMIEVDPRDANIVYAGYQFGYYFRIDRFADERVSIRPEHELGGDPYRFNWLTPIDLSEHNPDILYLGSNVVHRSMDQGETWVEISPDLTGGEVDGNVPFGTLTALAESEMRFGLIYAGSDDGLVHVSEDGGTSWDLRTDGLPERLWVSRLEPSSHEESRVYLALNGYRWDHFDTYLYRSDDYGTNWDRLASGINVGPVNVVREDPHNPDVLYLGTDLGAYVSIDGGETFSILGADLPTVPVHDLQVHPRERELIVGTHGRSIFIADVSHVERLTPEVLASTLHVFRPDSVLYDEDWGDRPNHWEDPETSTVRVGFFAGMSGSVGLRVVDDVDDDLFETEMTVGRGLNFYDYDLSTTLERLRRYLERTAEDLAADEGDSSFQEDDVEPADDGKVYLRPGRFHVEVEFQGEVRRVPLIVHE